jgi:ribonuclease BN (tRNA processing enzyme)
MKIILLGTGGPRPDPKRMGPSTLVNIGEVNIIIDAGRGVAARVVQAGVPITNVDYVFITHLHFDHVGGLADLLFAAWNKGRSKTIKVYGPRGTKEMMSHFFEAYSKDIWYRLHETALTHQKLGDIRGLVEVKEVEPGALSDLGEWMVSAQYVNHGHGLGLSQQDWPCLAYRVTSGSASAVFSGDAVTSPDLVEFSRNASVLVLCCYLAGDEVIDDDSKLISRYVLNSSLDAGRIAASANVGKLVLNHIREKSDYLLDSMVADVKRDYNGSVILGSDLLEIPL